MHLSPQVFCNPGRSNHAAAAASHASLHMITLPLPTPSRPTSPHTFLSISLLPAPAVTTLHPQINDHRPAVLVMNLEGTDKSTTVAAMTVSRGLRAGSAAEVVVRGGSDDQAGGALSQTISSTRIRGAAAVAVAGESGAGRRIEAGAQRGAEEGVEALGTIVEEVSKVVLDLDAKANTKRGMVGRIWAVATQGGGTLGMVKGSSTTSSASALRGSGGSSSGGIGGSRVANTTAGESGGGGGGSGGGSGTRSTRGSALGGTQRAARRGQPPAPSSTSEGDPAAVFLSQPAHHGILQGLVVGDKHEVVCFKVCLTPNIWH